MERQDITSVEESMEVANIRQQHEVERLTTELMQAENRAKAAANLMHTVVGSVTALGRELGEIANEAFELTDSMETLVARTNRVMHELKYVEMQAEQGQVDVSAAELLQKQLQDILRTLGIRIRNAKESDLQVMRDLGQDERRDVEDRRRRHEDERRQVEDERRNEGDEED